MIELKLPAMGADMEEGKLLEWRVKPGDAVKKGDIVAVVDTTKAAVEVESWDEGTMFEQRVPVGETVPVGTVIAMLLAPGEKSPSPLGEGGGEGNGGPSSRPSPKGEGDLSRKPVSPAARTRAKALGIDVETIEGTGPQGAVTIEDVEKAASTPKAPADRTAEMRKAIAAAMSRSKREIPHYYLQEPIPMARALEWLARENEKRPVTARLLVGVLQLKAVARALAKAPELNGFWIDGAFKPSASVHVGVAISIRQGGLIAPAIHDVERKGVDELMRDFTDLVARARAGSLRSSEMSDPSITVTNLGESGVESVLGVIYPPQVALVGFGRIDERPWVEDGAVKAVPVAMASLAADHRASDGIRGARFLAELRERLQHPEDL
jgi:pyruvate dehydrogenase E2 component (dihydrolipoamide acetyltransferase)